MSQNGTLDQDGSLVAPASPLPPVPRAPSAVGCEYASSLHKADLDASLDVMFTKLDAKFQSELHKTSQKLTGNCSIRNQNRQILETKQDELALAGSDLSREHESLSAAFTQIQAQVEDLDNRNWQNNLCLWGVPQLVTDLIPAAINLFKSLLPDHESMAFTCDRIHRALRPKPPRDSSLHEGLLDYRGDPAFSQKPT